MSTECYQTTRRWSKVEANVRGAHGSLRRHPQSILIPTEPIGSVARLLELLRAIATHDGADPEMELLYEEAVRDTIGRIEAAGSSN